MISKAESKIINIAVVGLVLIFCTKCFLILYTADQIKPIYAYLYYIPIVFGSFFFGISGGFLVSLAAGTAYTIFFFSGAIPSDYSELFFSVSSFILIGLLTGLLSSRLKRQLNQLKKLYKELNTTCNGILESLATAVDIKDHYTHKHSENVGKYAVALAKELNLSEKEIQEVSQAAQLHDVGKIGISDNILSKKEKLSEEDWDKIKLHPSKGIDILEPLHFLKEIIEFILHHHERYDGTGYPDHKKGGLIPMGARIICVADAFDTMLSDRPYRKALTKQAAIEELKKESGKQFDPKVVEIFLSLLEKNKI